MTGLIAFLVLVVRELTAFDRQRQRHATGGPGWLPPYTDEECKAEGDWFF
jgi:hypothetical protein